jgi:hypothetical protein
MLHAVALVRTDISEERTASIIRVTRISKRGTVTSNTVRSSLILVTLKMDVTRSSDMSVLTRATWRNISEDGILHSHRHENLKTYIMDLFLLFQKKIIFQCLKNLDLLQGLLLV